MRDERRTVCIMEATQIAGVSRRTIYNWINAGKLEYKRTAGGSIRIYEDTLSARVRRGVGGLQVLPADGPRIVKVPGCRDWKREPTTFCPCCGEQQVWVEDSAGDYYVGPTYLCVACGATGNMWEPNGGEFDAKTRLFLVEMERAKITAEHKLNTEHPFSRAVREMAEKEVAELERLKPQYEQRDGYRVRVRK